MNAIPIELVFIHLVMLNSNYKMCFVKKKKAKIFLEIIQIQRKSIKVIE